MAEPPESKYPGTELDLEDSFRLIEIQPGQDEDPIIVKLSPACLNEPPPYEALSYVWGDPNDVVPIHIAPSTPSSGSVSMSVTVNCHAALRRLRNANDPRVLWIDAICINQGLVPERNHQLRLVHRIYAHAERVVVYLGEHSNDSDAAMDWIRDIDKPEDFEVSAERDQRPKILRPNTDMIQALFERHWFGRIWVLQEVRYARNAIVVCGDRQVDWDSFRAFRYWNANTKWVKSLPYVVQWSVFQVSWAWGTRILTPYPKRLLVKLQDTRHCGATDPRDKLLAILPLLDWEEQRFNEKKQQQDPNGSIHDSDFEDEGDGVQEIGDVREKDGAEENTDVQKSDSALESRNERINESAQDRDAVLLEQDYSRSAVEVFTQLARNLIDALGLSVLREVVTPTAMSGLPSWAPDWSSNLAHPFLGRSRRARRQLRQSNYFKDMEWDVKKLKEQVTKTWSFSEYTIANGDLSIQLHVYAVIVGTINKLGDMCNIYENYLPIQQWESLVPDPKPLNGQVREYSSSDVSHDAYCKWKLSRISPFVKALAGDQIVYESALNQAMLAIREYNREASTSEWEKRLHSYRYPTALHSDEEGQAKKEQSKPKRLLRDIFMNMGPSYEDQAEAIFYNCHGKRFFVTDTGHIGMAPETAEVGDLVIAIKGSNVLFVVRPSAGQQSGSYAGSDSRVVNLIRKCYVQGMRATKFLENTDASYVEEIVIR